MSAAALPNSSRRFDVVFCDVDGCLMPEDASPADLAALGQIAAFQARALERMDLPILVPCTGRPQPYAEAVCRLLGCAALPAICESGVWFYDFAAHRWQMHPAISEGDRQIVRELERWVEKELGPMGCTLQLGKSAAVTVFHDDVAWLAREIVPMLTALIARNNWPLRVSMTWTCINCDLSHISKGSAIDLVIERFGLDRSRLAGIGDTLGDLAIRERVAWFGCPANADPALHSSANIVATQPLARGVLELLAHLV
jgi:hydroxymethylpyrimidine pyrophosphatase-like HAD family hydrolase